MDGLKSRGMDGLEAEGRGMDGLKSHGMDGLKSRGMDRLEGEGRRMDGIKRGSWIGRIRQTVRGSSGLYRASHKIDGLNRNVWQSAYWITYTDERPRGRGEFDLLPWYNRGERLCPFQQICE